MRAASAAGVVATLAVLAGCGGGGGAPRHRVHLTAFQAHGRTLFIRNCGACHTLADAGTGGIAGPALNAPWAANRVLEVIADGPSQMPAGLVTSRNARAVASYVAAATGGSPSAG